jgi:hypothetical protein
MLIDGQIKHLDDKNKIEVMQEIGKLLAEPERNHRLFTLFGLNIDTPGDCLLNNKEREAYRERNALFDLIINGTHKENAGKLGEYCGGSGHKWALAFCLMAYKLGYGALNQEWVFGWFANAIQGGLDARYWSKRREADKLHDLSESQIDITGQHALNTYRSRKLTFMSPTLFFNDFMRTVDYAIKEHQETQHIKPTYIYVDKASWITLSKNKNLYDYIVFAHSHDAIANGIVGMLDDMFIISDAYFKMGHYFIENASVG